VCVSNVYVYVQDYVTILVLGITIKQLNIVKFEKIVILLVGLPGARFTKRYNKFYLKIIVNFL